MDTSSLCILGCGNIGSAIAMGLKKSGMDTKNISITRRKIGQLEKFKNHIQNKMSKIWST